MNVSILITRLTLFLIMSLAFSFSVTNSLADLDVAAISVEEDSQVPTEGSASVPPKAVYADRANDSIASNLPGITEASEYVFEGVLVDARVHVPDGLRILATEYVFRVNQWFKGQRESDELRVVAAGGEYADGSGMTTSSSYKLTSGRCYLVWVKPGAENMLAPFYGVLQIYDGGSTVADSHGRIVTGIQNGWLVTRQEPEAETLFYLPQNPQRAEPEEIGPPEWSSEPLPDQPAAAKPPKSDASLPADAMFDLIKESTGVPAAMNSAGTILAGTELAIIPASVLCGYVRNTQYSYYWMPDDDNWDWSIDCRINWNTIVDDNPTGDDALLGYITSGGNPIRDRAPVCGDGYFNAGVPSDTLMVAGGYGTWASHDNANGITFPWYTGGPGSCTTIMEMDVFANPSIAGDEAQFRKTFTHEFGHALSLKHEETTFNLMYPGTYQQPPNYASNWYGRMDDMAGMRESLADTNSVWPGTWVFDQWTDMATWSQTHENWGTDGNLIMTDLSSYTANRGDIVTIRHMQVENRGNQQATNVELKIYLSTDTTISSSDDHQVWSGGWDTVDAHFHWSNGSLDFTIHSGIPAGSYYIGWIVSSDQSEPSKLNDIAIMHGPASIFPLRQLIVLGEPDCMDNDGDGYGAPGDPSCPGGSETDCEDANLYIYPTNPNAYCNCEQPYPEGTQESKAAGNCEDGIDNDCDGLVDSDLLCVQNGEDWAAANAEASMYGDHSLNASGSINTLGLLLVPLIVVIVMSIRRRRK